MILKFYRMHSIEEIQKTFPRLTDPYTDCSSERCGILRGWCPSMLDYTERILPIRNDDGLGFVELEGSPWYFDMRLGDVLIVDTEKTEDCYYLNRQKDALQDDEYTISPCRSETSTVGGIVNIPFYLKKMRYKRINRLKILLADKGGKVYDQMAIGNRT